ncbi:External alternative NAD(P)H-ubiquinone oxidoreductase B4, mitochondrial [Olea europaea subsp. europaea]|uniref:External alternative NAD(P)H-ubiquinone oxidoreductase B4, mitochondrial n=1 Tax=Olea europaea subsp. europaea TaxID=158383 RepID=A0A8S0RZD0_OLEEU|nr:External alternative NAD(P)H-ubiquinone oxidoreductase B4, mitochondrial [Olea europaea subsp. europaea]
MNSLVSMLKDSKGDIVKESVEVNLEEFTLALSKVDSQMKNLPATAQVAAQQGTSIFGQFAPLGGCRQLPNFLEIGFRLATAPSGFGILCMQVSWRTRALVISNWEGP